MITLTPAVNALLGDFIDATHAGEGDPDTTYAALHAALVADGHIQADTVLELDQAEDEDGMACHGLYVCDDQLLATYN